MSDLKTRPHDGDVEAFLATVASAERREDCRRVMALMAEITGEAPRMWGPSIIGFGSYHYRYASGREGDWFVTGLSPRQRALTLYIMAGFSRYEDLLAKLGKFRTGKSCLYVARLDDVHLPTLRRLITASVKHVRKSQG